MTTQRKKTGAAPGTSEWLTVQQVADHLQVSRVTVWRWIRSGRLSGIRVGRVRRIARSSLQEFLRQGGGKAVAGGSAKRRALGMVFTLTHPLWELVGKGRGGGANVSGNKYKYVAKAIDQR
jgi:excisionase family DNA binding protein